jgi:hypothetical protein
MLPEREQGEAMRHLLRTSVVAATCLLAVSGFGLQAQMGGQAGQGRGGRGGFGGQPVEGIVTAATASQLTIKTDAGDSYAVTVTDNSRIMRSGEEIKLSDVKPGDSVTARGTVDTAAKTVQAMMVMDVDAATVAKAKENMGKTYITGRLTAIDADNLKLTVMRTDNVSQVIGVDEGTSFQRGTRGVAADVEAAGGIAGGGGRGRRGQGGGAQAAPPAPESITLADIKVGDAVMATGTLKNGVFTALKMGVQEPGTGRGAGGGGRNREGAPPAGGPAAPAPPPQ